MSYTNHSHKPLRTFAGYCTHCGWGFTAAQSSMANFCPRCGAPRAKRNPTATSRRGNSVSGSGVGANHFVGPYASHGKEPRRTAHGHYRSGISHSRRCFPGGSTGKSSHSLIGKLTKIVPQESPGRALANVTRSHPIAVGAGVCFVGAGLVCAAPAMAAAGAAVTATGAGIASAGAVAGCLIGAASCLGRYPQGMAFGAGVAAVGVAFGSVVSFAGGLVLASGGVMAVGGAALAYGGGALALGSGARQLHLWELKHGHFKRGAIQLRDKFKRRRDAGCDKTVLETV